MEQGMNPEGGIIAGERNDMPEAMVLSKERWRRSDGCTSGRVSRWPRFARRLDLDRKTVGKAIRGQWKPYTRAGKGASYCNGLVAGRCSKTLTSYGSPNHFRP